MGEGVFVITKSNRSREPHGKLGRVEDLRGKYISLIEHKGEVRPDMKGYKEFFVKITGGENGKPYVFDFHEYTGKKLNKTKLRYSAENAQKVIDMMSKEYKSAKIR